MKRQFMEEDMQMPDKHMKWYLTPLSSRKMQIKTTRGYHYTPIRITEIKKK